VSALSINNKQALTTENIAAGTSTATQGVLGSTPASTNTAAGATASGKSGGSETLTAKSGIDRLESRPCLHLVAVLLSVAMLTI
jgi:hypothetical protein